MGRDNHTTGHLKTYLVPLGIFGISFLVRLAYIIHLKDTPIWDAMMIDAGLYDRWGMEIASGEWIGKNVFYDPPLYAYFLGVTYKLFGHDYLALRIIQALIGSAHCVIIFYLASYISDRRAGVAAGLFASFYGPLVFYDALVMKAFLSSALVDAGLLTLLGGMTRKKYRWWFVHGLLLGLASLLRLNIMIFIFIEGAGFAWLIIRGKPHPARAKSAITAALWALGIVIVFTPVTLRNYHVSGNFVLVSSYMGQNFYTGNNPYNTNRNYQRLPFVRANPKYEQEDFRREAVRRLGSAEITPSAVSAFWFREALLYIEAQPFAFLKRLWTRFRIFWSSYEMPDCYNMSFISRHFAPMLRFLPGFGIIAPLGLLGMALTARYWRRLWPFYVFLAVYMCSIIVFFVFARYRLPVAGTLAAFGGAALVKLWDIRKHAKQLGASIALGAVLFVLINLPPPYKVLDSKPLCNLGTLSRRRGEMDKAVDYYRRAIEVENGSYEAHYFLATTLREMNRCREAVKEYEASLAIRPGDFNSLAGLGICHEKLGDTEKAEQLYVKALKANMKLSDIRLRLVRLMIKAGEKDKALEQLRTLLLINPMHREALSLYRSLAGEDNPQR